VTGRVSRAVAALFALAAAASAAVPAADAQPGSPEARFHAGNEAYAAGRFAEAVESYGELARLGIEDPRVEYNLANALFKTGKIGPAILHWERARRLDPTDREVRDNLAFARTLIEDRVEVPDPGAVVRAVRGVQDRIGPDGFAAATLAVWWTIAALVAIAFARPSGWTPALVWTASVLVALALVLGASWWFTWDRLHGTPIAVVLAEATELRAGPGDNNAALLTVHEGLTVVVRQERDGWVQVSLPDNLNGWVRADGLGEV